MWIEGAGHRETLGARQLSFNEKSLRLSTEYGEELTRATRDPSHGLCMAVIQPSKRKWELRTQLRGAVVLIAGGNAVALCLIETKLPVTRTLRGWGTRLRHYGGSAEVQFRLGLTG